MLREIPYDWAWNASTNLLTHTTYIGALNTQTNTERVMVLDDRTGSFATARLGSCFCVGEQVSDDHAGNLFLAPGGETTGLFILDEATRRLRTISQVGVWSLAVDQTTDVVYAADAFHRVIHKVNGKTGRFVGTINSGFAVQMAVDPVRKLLYAVNQSSGDRAAGGYGNPFDVVVIDLTTDRVVGHLPQAAGHVAIDVARDLIYAPTTASDIAVISGRTHATVRRIPLPHGLHVSTMAFNPVNRRLYALAGADCFQCPEYVVVVDTARGTVLTKIRVGAFAIHLSIDPTLNRVYVAAEQHVVVLAG